MAAESVGGVSSMKETTRNTFKILTSILHGKSKPENRITSEKKCITEIDY